MNTTFTKKPKNFKDLTGQKFGTFTVTCFDESRFNDTNRTYWIIKCECGIEKSSRPDSIQLGVACSCHPKKTKIFKPRKDITNQKFNKLTAISVNQEKSLSHRSVHWNCLCDCGNRSVVQGYDLTSGNSKSCGCLNLAENKHHEDLTGQKFNRLTVLKMAERKDKQAIMWECLCECGNNSTVIGSALKGGKIKSCGCFFTDKMTKHGMCETSEYTTHNRLKKRCSKEHNHPEYYYDKGITVCDRWQEPNGVGFLNFLADMGKKPTKSHSIDRIDVNGNYEPSNCRWATREEQSNNTTRTRLLTFNGETLSISQWSRRYDISSGAITNRLDNLKWSIEKSLTTPPKRAKNFNSKKVIKSILNGIKSRCLNEKASNYHYYGGRGITVSSEWTNIESGYNSFISDMGNRPSENHTVDRRDNSKGYSKENCFWASKKEQANNTRSNKTVVAFNREQTLSRWSDELGVPSNTISRRITSGWNPEEAVTKPTYHMVFKTGIKNE